MQPPRLDDGYLHVCWGPRWVAEHPLSPRTTRPTTTRRQPGQGALLAPTTLSIVSNRRGQTSTANPHGGSTEQACGRRFARLGHPRATTTKSGNLRGLSLFRFLASPGLLGGLLATDRLLRGVLQAPHQETKQSKPCVPFTLSVSQPAILRGLRKAIKMLADDAREHEKLALSGRAEEFRMNKNANSQDVERLFGWPHSPAFSSGHLTGT